MEVIMELIGELGELFFEGCIDIIENKNLSKWIRYPLTVLMMFLYAVVILLLIYVALLIWQKNIFCGIILVIFVIIFLAGTIGYFYKKKKQ